MTEQPAALTDLFLGKTFWFHRRWDADWWVIALFFLKLENTGLDFSHFHNIWGEGLTKLLSLVSSFISLVNLDNSGKQLYTGKFFQNFCRATQRVGGGWCTEASGFSLDHICHSVTGKTKHQFTRVELGNGRCGIAVTWLSCCLKGTVLSHNPFRASLQSVSFCTGWGGVSLGQPEHASPSECCS